IGAGRAGYQSLAIGRERNRVNLAGMPMVVAEFSRCRIPKGDIGSITGSQIFAIRRVGQVKDLATFAPELPHFLAGGQVIQAHERSEMEMGNGKLLAIRGES